MSYKPGDTAYFSIPVQSSTGAATNADSTPTVIVRKNGTLDGAVLPAVAASGTTGLYDASFTIPSGYAAGDTVAALATVVVGGITSPPVTVWREVMDTARNADVQTRLGAPVGASISADIAGVQSDAANLKTRVPGALVSGRMDSSAGAIATDAISAASLATGAVTKIQSGLSTYAGGAVSSVTNPVTVGTNNDKAGYSLSATGIQAVWDNLLSATYLTGSIGAKFKLWLATLGSDNKVILSANAQTGVTIPTVTTLTGHTPQSGDSFARIGANGVGLADILDNINNVNNNVLEVPNSVRFNLDATPLNVGSVNTVEDFGDNALQVMQGIADNAIQPVKLKTDNLPASPAAVGSAMTLTTSERDSIATRVWASGTRSLTTFDTLVSDIASAVWDAGTRTLSAFGFTVNTNPNATELATLAKLQDAAPGEEPVVPIPGASDPSQVVVYSYTRDATGALEGGVEVVFQLRSATALGIYAKEVKVTSSAEAETLGQIAVPLARSASYQARRGAGNWKHFNTPDADSFELPAFIGG